MPSVPDDHLPHHDPGQPAAGDIMLAGLREKYGSDWTILIHLDSAIVSAEHRSGDGRAVRYLVAHAVAELAARLETAGTVEP
jgi:hypothetical protein